MKRKGRFNFENLKLKSWGKTSQAVSSCSPWVKRVDLKIVSRQSLQRKTEQAVWRNKDCREQKLCSRMGQSVIGRDMADFVNEPSLHLKETDYSRFLGIIASLEIEINHEQQISQYLPLSPTKKHWHTSTIKSLKHSPTAVSGFMNFDDLELDEKLALRSSMTGQSKRATFFGQNTDPPMLTINYSSLHVIMLNSSKQPQNPSLRTFIRTITYCQRIVLKRVR